MKSKEMEIPFGAEDSELIESTYHIPDGMEAIIEGDKVIIRKKKSEDERIRKEIIEFVEFVADSRSNKEEWLAWLKKRTKL